MTLSVKISRAELHRGLRLAQSVAPRKGSLPILSSVLLRANGKGTLALAATDLNVSLTAELPCKVDGQGSLVLDAADLGRFVASAPDGDIAIVGDGSLRADVKAGRAKYRIAGLADRDFPKVSTMPDGGAEVDAAVLHDAISRVSYAVSTLEADEAKCGVMLLSDGASVELCGISTGGHRVAMIKRQLALPRTTKRISVSAPGMASIVRLLADQKTCRVALDETRFHVSAAGVAIGAGLLNFACPPIERIMAMLLERKSKETAVVNRDRLLEALKRVSPLASEYTPVRITANQTGLSLSVRDSEGEELSDELECDVAGDFKVGANAKYLTDAVTNMIGDTVTLRFSGELDPIVFQDNDDPGYTAIVMPMRM